MNIVEGIDLILKTGKAVILRMTNLHILLIFWKMKQRVIGDCQSDIMLCKKRWEDLKIIMLLI